MSAVLSEEDKSPPSSRASTPALSIVTIHDLQLGDIGSVSPTLKPRAAFNGPGTGGGGIQVSGGGSGYLYPSRPPPTTPPLPEIRPPSRPTLIHVPSLLNEPHLLNTAITRTSCGISVEGGPLHPHPPPPHHQHPNPKRYTSLRLPPQGRENSQPDPGPTQSGEPVSKVTAPTDPKVKLKRKKDKRERKNKKRARSKSCPVAANITSDGKRLFRTNKDDPDNVRLPNISGSVSGSEGSRTAWGSGGGSSAPKSSQASPVLTSAGEDGTGVAEPVKKPRRMSLLHAIKPENQEAEKEKFVKSDFRYNPQFVYRYETTAKQMERYATPADELLKLAVRIMTHALARYGSYETYEAATGGRRLTRTEITEAAYSYLRQEGLEQEVSVRLSDDLLARASMSRVRGQPTLQVRANSVREGWMEGLLRHEIGTHYLRSRNNRQQPWATFKRRREFGLGPINPTEEGLASLHSVLCRPEPCLWRSAMLYYVAHQANVMSFVELFRDLGRFVSDVDVRWDFCMRAKRGQTDTSKPGGFSKDQVYLIGSMYILKHRHLIDFHMLYRCGKVDVRDVERLKDSADVTATKIPAFMEDLQVYGQYMDDIMAKNGLTDADLVAVV